MLPLRCLPINIDELIIKVDVIPVSIALAQAALESGWGTSRFVSEGNALFGQWSWFKGSGIVPEQRDAEESHEIKIFKTLRGSVTAYMKNLNSNNNYDDFRLARNLRRRIRYALVSKNIMKTKTTMNLIGCSATILKNHLESLFNNGMNWENYGVKGWHVDHIMPCAAFDLSKESEQKNE